MSQPQQLTFSEKWVFDPIQRFQTWVFGDTQSSTFETRKTVFEILFASLGVIVLTKTLRSVFGDEFI